MQQNSDSGEYIVVLRYTEAAGAYKGVMYWTGFADKAGLDEWMAAIGSKDQVVVEEGITEERATKLAAQTPKDSYIAVAIHEATDPETGEVNVEYAKMKVAGMGLAVGLAQALSERQQ